MSDDTSIAISWGGVIVATIAILKAIKIIIEESK